MSPSCDSHQNYCRIAIPGDFTEVLYFQLQSTAVMSAAGAFFPALSSFLAPDHKLSSNKQQALTALSICLGMIIQHRMRKI